MQYSLAGDLLEVRVGFSKVDLKFGSLSRGFVKHSPGVRELGLVKRLYPRHLNENNTTASVRDLHAAKPGLHR